MASDYIAQLLAFFKFSLSDPIDAHKAFFVSRRAVELSLARPTWIDEPGLVQLKKELTQELILLSAYVNDLLKTRKAPGPLGGATEPGSPNEGKQYDELKSQEFVAPKVHHLDLADVAITRDDTSESEASARREELLQGRRRRVPAIAWRAAAIHPTLWEPSTPPLAGLYQIDKVAMNEIVDRRLRSVERMTAQVSKRVALGGVGIPAPPNTPRGPWPDHFRVRPFEYPRIEQEEGLGKNGDGRVPRAIGPSHILDEKEERFKEGDEPWMWNAGKHRLFYNVPPEPGLRGRPEIQAHWRALPVPPNDPNGEVVLSPTAPTTAAQAVDLLFRGKFDWWERTWLFCDHVISALHVEALLFALRRRNSSNGKNEGVLSDDEFNNEVAKPSYVVLAHQLSNSAKGRLMNDGDGDKYFENSQTVSGSDLQIGDHVAFLNSKLHSLLIMDEWRVENALIIDLASQAYRPDKSNGKFPGGVVRAALVLQGHGIPPKPHAKYQGILAKQLNARLTSMRLRVAKESKNDVINLGAVVGVAWSPFEDFQANPKNPPAWWLGIVADDKDRGWETQEQVRQNIPEVIIPSDIPGTPIHPFPQPKGFTVALYPLYQPQVKGGWRGYLAARGSTSPRFTKPPSLKPFQATKDSIPGVFRGNEDRPLHIIRPRVRPEVKVKE